MMTKLLLHVAPFLSNDRETNSHCWVTAPQTNVFPQQRDNTEIMDDTFCTRSLPRRYNQDQLAVAVSCRNQSWVSESELDGEWVDLDGVSSENAVTRRYRKVPRLLFL
jgi:hypothetical protein